jgi:hypothetical protein
VAEPPHGDSSATFKDQNPLLLSTYLPELDNPRSFVVDSSWTSIDPKADLSEIISNNISNKLFIKNLKIHFTNKKKYFN